MVLFRHQPQPQQTWGDVLGSIGTALAERASQARSEQQRISQGSLLQGVLSQLGAQQNPSYNQIMQAFAQGQTQGLDPQYMQNYLQNYPKFQQEQTRAAQLQQAQTAPQKPDVTAQKWAYEQLQAEPLIKKSNQAIDKILTLAETGATGPLKGRVPDWASPEEERKVRAAIDAEALNVIGTHSALFRNGSFTDREFNFIKDKTLSSKMSKAQIQEVAKIYKEMNDLAMRRFEAIRQASKDGFTPDLPFRVSEIEQQGEAEALRLKNELLDKMGYKEEETFSLRNKKTGQVEQIPIQYREEASRDPDYEMIDQTVPQSSQTPSSTNNPYSQMSDEELFSINPRKVPDEEWEMYREEKRRRKR